MKKGVISFIVITALIVSLFSTTAPLRASAAKAGIVYARGTQFVLDGYPFYYAGCNSYDLFTKSYAEIDKRMSEMAEYGIKVVRTWGFSHEEWHGFEPVKGVYSEEQFRLFDYIMKSAGEHGIKIIITLENYWEAYGGIDSRLKWEGLPGVSHTNRAKFFTDPGCKESYSNYIKHFVNRTNFYTGVPYKEDPDIFAWELMNEPRYQDAGENSTGITLRKWVDEMGSLIKTLDPNHMVACGIEGHESKYGFGGDEGNPFIYIQQSPYIDFCTAHPYPDEKWADLTPEEAGVLVEKWIEDAHNVVKKPFVLEEFNTHDRKSAYWTAMLGEMEQHDAAGDNFWNYNSISTSNFDMLHGDTLLTTLFKQHAEKMESKNSSPVHKPLDFEQVYPGNASTGILPAAVFKWEPAVGAKTYNLIVAEDTGFKNPVMEVTGLRDTKYTSSKDLKFGTKYYWKVTAVNPLGGTDALNSGASFSTRAAPSTLPGKFNLSAPQNNSVVSGLRPQFSWSGSDEALNYRITVSGKSDFSSPVIDVGRIAGTSYTPEKDLELGNVYYWNVTAENNIGSTKASNSGACFTTPDLPPVNTTVKVSAAINGSSKQETQYKIVVSNTGGSSIDKFSARLYLDLSEIFNEGYSDKNILSEKLYDQTSGKTTMEGPVVWDEDKKIYYIQINWNGYELAEGKTIEQDVRIRLDNWASCLDASNDYSYKDLGGEYKDTENIPLYRGNLKIWGKDPLKSGTVPSPEPSSAPNVSGYIAPDLNYPESAESLIKAGFTVEIQGISEPVKTDSRGYFEMPVIVSGTSSTCTVKISKPGYLTRIMEGIEITGDRELSSPESPILLWAGDIPKNNVQDNAINISDIMEVAGAFNSSAGDGRYAETYDLNMDNAVNITDIMIVAGHFNSVPGSYVK